ncbi:hypothetical protein ABPG75_010577 [Micractinium tetrahymenae]
MRRRGAAAASLRASRAPAATIADLPDELLARCLEPLDQGERLGSAALVSKQFYRACALLPVDVSITGPWQDSEAAQARLHARLHARLLALRSVLSKHAPPVRSLRFHSHARGAKGQKEIALLVACLGLCSGHLQQLQIKERVPLPLSCLPPLRGLRQLWRPRLCAFPLRLPVGIAQLAALKDLTLEGSAVQFEGQALPPGITQLRLEDMESTRLPAQLSSLRSLARLELDCQALKAGSLRLLGGLPALTAVYLLPFVGRRLAGLGLEAATQLQQLNANLSPEAVAGLDAVLPALQHLGTLRSPFPTSLASAALVSRRFCRVCATLPLDVSLHDRAATRLLRVRASWRARLQGQLLSLCAYLAKHAPPVRSLRFSSSAAGAAGQEEMAVLAGCLGLCSAAGSPLQRLHIEACVPPVINCMCGLSALQQLQLSAVDGAAASTLRLPPSFSQLTALADVELKGRTVQFEGHALPPGITRLRLEDWESTQLPRQLSTLRSLARMELECRALEPGNLRLLGSLPSLTSLRLVSLESPLAGLEAATQLQQLEIDGISSSEETDALEAVLPALQRLSILSLSFAEPQPLPPSLASLPRLERLCVKCVRPAGGEGGGDAPSLPPGPWPSLRYLAVPWLVLHTNVSTLRSALALEHLSCFGLPEPGGEDAPSRSRWGVFWSYVEDLPALRCLCIHCPDGLNDDLLSPALTKALLVLADRRPALRRHFLGYPAFFSDLLTMADIPASPSAYALYYTF